MRLRLYFSKTGALRYIGHLDLHTLWERTIRRAGLPLSYTQGFHPGPKIQLASALPLGFIGCCEIVDIWLDDSFTLDIEAQTLSAKSRPSFAGRGSSSSERSEESIETRGRKAAVFQQDDFAHHYINRIQPSCPPGLTVLSAEPVDEKSPALQTQVISAEYEVSFLDPLPASEIPALSGKIASLLAAASLPAERRGKPYDLRPLIENLILVGAVRDRGASVERNEADPPKDEPSIGISMRLAAREGATGRPEAVLEALGIPFESTRIERTRIILKADA